MMNSVIEYITRYFEELIALTNAMAPYLLLGFLFAGILHVYFKKERVAKLLGSNKVRSTMYASLIGVPLPLCSCGVIPTGVSFYKNGASKGSTVSFLISTPQTGIDSIMATYSMLGLPFAILRPFIAFVSGIFGGTFTNVLERNEETNSNQTLNESTQDDKRPPLIKMLHYAFVEFMQDIAKWLVIGLLLAALISLLLPPDFFSKYISNDFLSMIVILAASIPLYVCATGSIPIATVLMMKGISPGAALVFLMAGPATNAATITVIGKVMGRKSLFSYLFSIIGASLLFGFIIDQFLPREWFTSFIMHTHEHDGHGLPFWFEVASSILLTGLIINIYFQKYLRKRKAKSTITAQNPSEVNGEHIIQVEGMDCNHCKVNIENGISNLQNIESVEANIENATVKIKTKLFNQELIKETVESLGYKFKGEMSKNQFQFTPVKTYKIRINGMSCNHCKANVEKALSSMVNLSKVEVNLEESSATFEGTDINLDEIKNHINDIGYEFKGLIN